MENFGLCKALQYYGEKEKGYNDSITKGKGRGLDPGDETYS